jgi:plastocyanin
MRPLRLSTLIAIAALTVASCGGSTPSAAPATAGGDSQAPVGSTQLGCESADAGTVPSVAVRIEGFAYAPEPVTAKVDEVIVWTNNDSAPHTASLSDGSCGTEQLAGGASGALVFHAAGTYDYQCNIHPGQMNGFTIEVTS